MELKASGMFWLSLHVVQLTMLKRMYLLITDNYLHNSCIRPDCKIVATCSLTTALVSLNHLTWPLNGQETAHFLLVDYSLNFDDKSFQIFSCGWVHSKEIESTTVYIFRQVNFNKRRIRKTVLCCANVHRIRHSNILVLAGVLFNLDFRTFYGYSLFSIMASTYFSIFIYLLLIYFHFGSGE